jgi:hypothetical protein
MPIDVLAAERIVCEVGLSLTMNNAKSCAGFPLQRIIRMRSDRRAIAGVQNAGTKSSAASHKIFELIVLLTTDY